jgi:Fe-S-cluster containining protein
MRSKNQHTTAREALAELEHLYGDLDAEIASARPTCRTCGTCCDFKRGGYVLYASHIETAYFADNVDFGTVEARPDVCPFLESGSQDSRVICTAHDFRPLGCRTFFCDANFRERHMELYEKYRKLIASLSDGHGCKWDYGPFFEKLAKTVK